MRALRSDKLTYAALEATIAAYASGQALAEIPSLAALRTTKEAIARRARAFIRRAKGSVNQLALRLLDGYSVVGGGSAPAVQLPTALISVTSGKMNADELAEILRRNNPPVIARIVADQLALDLRTVTQAEEKALLLALKQIG
jgi:L-seryl-tRNA(Ser) seleniumtransferase